MSTLTTKGTMFEFQIQDISSTARRPKAKENLKKVISKNEKPQSQQMARKAANQAKWQKRAKKSSETKHKSQKLPPETYSP
jgi:hypothetical protein